MKYNDRIYALMIHHDLTVDFIAKILKTDVEEVEDILAGVLTPTMDQLIDLGDLFHCSIDYLVCRSGIDRPDMEVAIIELPEITDQHSLILNLYNQLSRPYQLKMIGYGFGLLKKYNI